VTAAEGEVEPLLNRWDPRLAHGEFLGHNGKTKTVKTVVQVAGCKPILPANH
jgi:hypothetical protein